MLTKSISKKIIIGLGILTGIMSVIVVFIISPMVDGKTGMEVVKLQLSFTTDNGKLIINGWNKIGQQNFLKYIYTDYIYAFAYSFFLSSLYLNKLLKNNIKIVGKHLFILVVPFVAGLFDMIENTIEIFFIKNPNGFSELIFCFHSVLASSKLLGISIVLYFLIKHIKQ